MDNYSCACEKSDLSLLQDTLDQYAAIDGSLITILQKAQDIYGFLPWDVLCHISSKIGTTPAHVLGVATFYTQFRFKPVGKHLIMLCQGTACHVNGSELIASAIREELGISDGETTEDGLFSLACVACLGCCSLSPVMMINEDTYGRLTPAKTREILRAIAKKEEVK